jgi:hypothetical protein
MPAIRTRRLNKEKRFEARPFNIQRWNCLGG